MHQNWRAGPDCAGRTACNFSTMPVILWLSVLIEDGLAIMKYRDPKQYEGMAERPTALTMCEVMIHEIVSADVSTFDSAAADLYPLKFGSSLAIAVIVSRSVCLLPGSGDEISTGNNAAAFKSSRIFGVPS